MRVICYAFAIFLILNAVYAGLNAKISVGLNPMLENSMLFLASS